ncbi:hypothetical protein RUND412_010791, partial [Rhizina undulata]
DRQDYRIGYSLAEQRTLERQDPSLNDTMLSSMLQEQKKLRNTQLQNRHKLIHDAIVAGELLENEKRKTKLAAKPKTEQEELKVEEEKEGSNDSYSYKFADLTASMFKLNLTDIDEHAPEQGSRSKNDQVNHGTTTTQDKGKGRVVEDDLVVLGPKFVVSDIGSQKATKPHSSQCEFQAAHMRLELAEADINHYRPKPLPVPPEVWLLRDFRRQPGFGMTAENSVTDNQLEGHSGTFIDLHWNDSNIISNPYNLHKHAVEREYKIQKVKLQRRNKGNLRNHSSHRNCHDYDVYPIDSERISSSSSSGDGEVLTTTDESFTKLRERINELEERLRRQMNQGKFEDSGTNSTVPAAAPASGRPKAPSEVSISDATGSEKFATAPESPTQSIGDDDQSPEEEDIVKGDPLN